MILQYFSLRDVKKDALSAINRETSMQIVKKMMRNIPPFSMALLYYTSGIAVGYSGGTAKGSGIVSCMAIDTGEESQVLPEQSSMLEADPCLCGKDQFLNTAFNGLGKFKIFLSAFWTISMAYLAMSYFCDLRKSLNDLPLSFARLSAIALSIRSSLSFLSFITSERNRSCSFFVKVLNAVKKTSAVAPCALIKHLLYVNYKIRSLMLSYLQVS